MVAEKQRLRGFTLTRLIPVLDQLQDSDNYRLLPLTAARVIESTKLTAIPDIFDRLVAAEAWAWGVPLLTKDSSLADSGYVRVVWDEAAP